MTEITTASVTSPKIMETINANNKIQITGLANCSKKIFIGLTVFSAFNSLNP